MENFELRGDVEKRALEKSVLIIIPVILAIGVYLNSLQGQFVSDDLYQVLANPWLAERGHLGDIFFSSVWSFHAEGSGSPYYRPMMYVSYLFSHSLSGLNPWGYHLVNIILHAANSAALFILGGSLFRIETERGRELGKGFDERQLPSWAFALAAASIFAVHTVNTEAVNWVASIPELSFSLCFILAFYLFIKGRARAAGIIFFVSLLYKETAFMLLPMLVCFDLLYRDEGNQSGAGKLNWIKRYYPFAAALAIYLVMRFIALGAVGAGAIKTTGTFTNYEYAANIVPLLFEYLKLLVWPANLIFYAHMRWETLHSFFEVRSIVLILVSAYVLYSLWRFRRKAPTIVIAAVWMALPLAPILISGWAKGFPLFAERYLYLSSAGFALFVAYLALMLFNALGRGRSVAVIIVAAFMLATAALSIATIKRNSIWATPYTLWRDTATKAPYVVDARVNHANELSKQGRLIEAKAEYKAALGLDPLRASTHNGLGILYGKQGLLKEAVIEFERALSQNPDSDERAAITMNLLKTRKMLTGGAR